jgi:hypothetical protein
MRKYKLIYLFGILISRKMIIEHYGKAFYKRFREVSKEWINKIAPQTPDIGNTVFSMNYAFTPSYIAWWKAACEQLPNKQADKLVWKINERVFSLIPKRIAPVCIKIYMNTYCFC